MQTKKKLSIAKSEDLASLPTEYILYIDEALKTQKHFSETNLSKKLIRKWTDVHEDDKEYFRDPYHKLIFPFLEKRKDLYVPLAPPPVSVAVSEAILLHCVNHVLKSTARIRKNNKRVSESKPDEKFSGQQDQFLDQGFTRPKVLLLAPFQSDAYDLIETIIRIVPDSQKKSVDNQKRFEAEYNPPREDAEYFSRKPPDYRQQFGRNNNDNFKIGVSFLPKTVKLYADFYKSDFVVASPLALKLIMETESSDEDSAEDGKVYNIDFLSSIEIVLLYKADLFLMQNWRHVETVLGFLNLIPSKAEHTDFFRVKKEFLEGKAKLYRQNILLSSFRHPNFTSLFAKSVNRFGKTVIRPLYKTGAVTKNRKQVFLRFRATALKEAHTERLETMKNKILKEIVSAEESQNLIFVSRYFDFIALRNYFSRNNYSFDYCSEHSTVGDNSRARTNFLNGKTQFLIITERFYFFRRLRIRGIRNLLFFDLPLNSHFYNELVDAVNADGRVCALFCKYDGDKLERILGSDKKIALIGSDGESFMVR